VANFHPLVKQAQLLSEAASQELLMSRGFFDPKLGANFNQKTFDGKNYYNFFNPEIKIPTWPGIDLKAGFERNVGQDLSSSDITPNNGLQYLGIGLPIGQGLFTDQRRTILKQAKIGLDLADAEKVKEINKIIFSAAKDYWEWYFTQEQLQNAQLAFRLSDERYRAVKQRVAVGDLAPIDSVEAHIFFQDRDIFLRQSQLEEQQARLHLSAYIWSADGEPIDIGPGARAELPGSFQTLVSDSLLGQIQELARTQHPEIRKLNFIINQLELDKRLALEMFKPSLNLHYSWLSRTDESILSNASLDRSYKLGFDFSFPILLRKERGKQGMVKTKIFQTQLEKRQTLRDINLSISASFIEIKNLENLIRLQNQMVNNYQKLRDGEVKKFANGESSLFLINSRESKLIEGQIKLASFLAKYQKERAHIFYNAGRNPLNP
jgi:outer membrane protein TolC